jgi:hypothetical protein
MQIVKIRLHPLLFLFRAGGFKAEGIMASDLDIKRKKAQKWKGIERG